MTNLIFIVKDPIFINPQKHKFVVVFPKWAETIKRITQVKKKIDIHVATIKNDFPELSEAISASITTILPPPLNYVILKAWNAAGSTDKDANLNGILEKLDQIVVNDKERYDIIGEKFNSCLQQLSNFKSIEKKEYIFTPLLDALTSNARNFDTNLEHFQKSLSKLTEELKHNTEATESNTSATHGLTSALDNNSQHLIELNRILQKSPSQNHNEQESDNTRNIFSDIIHSTEPDFVYMDSVFEGRKKLVGDIVSAINNNTRKFISIRRTISGIGKTQIALRSLYNLYHKYKKKVIIIRFEEQITYARFLRLIDQGLGIQRYGKNGESEQYYELRKILFEKFNPVLLCDSFEVVEKNKEKNSEYRKIFEFLNGLPNGTNVLITSTIEKKNSFGLEELSFKKIKGLDEIDALIAFQKHMNFEITDPNEKENLEKEVLKLINYVGGHPRSLKILARSYNKEDGVSQIQKMINMIQNEKEDENIKLRHETFVNCISYSLANLPDVNERIMFKQLLIFNSNFPYFFARELFGIKKTDIENLQKTGLIDKIHGFDSENEDFDIFNFDPFVKRVISKKIPEKIIIDQAKKIDVFYRFLKIILKKIDEGHLFSYKVLKSMFEFDNDLENLDINNKHPLKSSYLNLLGRALRKCGFYNLSIKKYNEALQIDKSNNDLILTARDYSNLGPSYANAGDLENAENSIETSIQKYCEALKIIEDFNPKEIIPLLKKTSNHINEISEEITSLIKSVKDGLVTAHRYKAINYRNIGRYQEALECIKKAKEFDHVEQNEKLCRVEGTIYRNQGKLVQAMGILEKIFETNKQNSNTVLNERDIAITLNMMGKFQEAKIHLDKTWKFDKDNENLKGLARDYANKGISYHGLGKCDLALKQLSEAIRIDRELENDVNVARDSTNIGIVLRSFTNPKYAENYFIIAKEIQNVHNNSLGIAFNNHWLGIINRDMGEYQEAWKFFLLALDIDIGRENDVLKASTLRNMSVMIRDIAQIESLHKILKMRLNKKYEKVYESISDSKSVKLYDLAIDFLKLSEEIDLKNSDNYRLIKDYHNLGITERLKQNYKKALYYLNKTQNFDNFSTNKITLARYHRHRGITFGEQNYYKKALSELEKSNEILNENNSNVLDDARNNRHFGKIFFFKGSRKKYSKSDLTKAYDYLTKAHTMDSETTHNRELMWDSFWLGEVCIKLKKYDDANDHYEKTNELVDKIYFHIDIKKTKSIIQNISIEN